MKKLLTFLILLTLFTFIGINADGDESVNYELITYDNSGYNLLTGAVIDDINMSRSNRVPLALNANDNQLYFVDVNFSHILFYDAYNTYMGYCNGEGVTLILSSNVCEYDDDDGENYMFVPERARKFAVMNYNYQDTQNSLAYTQPSIDIEAFGGETYRDLYDEIEDYGDFVLSAEQPNILDWLNNTPSSSPHITGGITYTWDSQGYITINGTSTSSANLYLYPIGDLVLEAGTYTIRLDNAETGLHLVLGGNGSELTYTNDTELTFTLTEEGHMGYVLIQVLNGYTFTNKVVTVQLELGSTATGYAEYGKPVIVDNLIENGDFSIDLDENGVGDSWIQESSTSYELNNGIQKITVNSSNAKGLRGQLPSGDYWGYDHDYYVDFDYKAQTGDTWFFVMNNGIYQKVINLDEDDIWNDYTLIFTYTSDDSAGTDYYKFQNSGTTENIIEVDNVAVYDLTAIYGKNNEPTLEEFEMLLAEQQAYKDYYLKYKDISGETFTYDDIFSENLIENGDFSDGYSAWYRDVDFDTFEVANGELHVNNIASASLKLYQALSTGIPINQYYYLQYDVRFISSNLTYNKLRLYSTDGATTVSYYQDNITNEMTTYNHIDFDESTDVGYFALLWNTDALDAYYDNAMLFDLTEIFENGDVDITEEFMEDGYNIWVDPLAEYYDTYQLAGTMITNTFYYYYDEIEEEPADFGDTFDDGIDDLGIDSSPKKLFLAFVIMASIAVILGLKFRNFGIVMIAEVALIFIFTVLGWFELWVILTIAIILVLLIIIKALKGGSR